MLPASRILEIVGASPLSDDDIQQLIEQLLEKRNTNAEWQEVSGGGCGHLETCGAPPLLQV